MKRLYNQLFFHTVSFAVNPPGSADWVMTSSYRKWEENSDSEEIDLSDQQLTVNYLEKINRHYSLIVLDNGKYIAC